MLPGEMVSCDDKKWTQGAPMVEEQWESKIADKVTKAVQEVLSKNLELPKSTFCNVVNTEFQIKLKGGVVPKFVRQYPVPQALIPQVVSRIQEWMENDWTEIVKDPPEWNSPLLAAKKVSGGVEDSKDIRLCMDFREVNKVSEEPEYRVPLVRSLLSKLTGKKYFTELDLASAYHQILLAKESMRFTCFKVPKEGFARWCRMFFGAKGAVTHFQWVMETVMGKVSPDVSVVVYVDNIVVASDELDQHIKDVIEVIRVLTKAGFKLKLPKCKFAFRSLKFMGSIIDGKRRAVDQHKVAVFRNMRRPTRGKEVSSLLGFVNYLREYIPLYSCIFGPLEALRSKRAISEDLWVSSGAKKSFDLAKDILSKTPVLNVPDFERPFHIETDASQYGVGAILFQLDDDEKPVYIDFAAKALTSGQVNYAAMKRELLAGMFAMETWRSFLLFRKFYWGMDNQALTFLKENKSRVILNWAIIKKMRFQMIFNDGYFWPTLFKECLKITKSCILCLKFNIKGGGFHPARTITAGVPFDHVLWDLIGKLPTSMNGYNFILVIIDVLTRFVILRPLVTKSAVEIASCLVEVFANFGVPKILQSDNDRALLNETTEKIRGLAGFQFRRIMAYFPRTNGVVERFIQGDPWRYE